MPLIASEIVFTNILKITIKMKDEELSSSSSDDDGSSNRNRRKRAVHFAFVEKVFIMSQARKKKTELVKNEGVGDNQTGYCRRLLTMDSFIDSTK